MITSIGTHIKVADFQKSENFYTSLGFAKVFEYGPNKSTKEDYNGAVFEHGGCRLEIANGHRAVKPEVFLQQIASSKISLMIFVDDLEDIIRRCEVNKIRIAVRPRHFYWGTLELVIKGPDGEVLVFTAPYDKSVAKKISADETWSIPSINP